MHKKNHQRIKTILSAALIATPAITNATNYNLDNTSQNIQNPFTPSEQSNNNITLNNFNGGSNFTLYGGYGEAAQNNNITINGGTIGHVFGGYSETGGNISGNNTLISNLNIQLSEGFGVRASSKSTTVTNNYIKLINTNLYTGTAGATDYGIAKGNTYEFIGGTSYNISGGDSPISIDNTVILNNATNTWRTHAGLGAYLTGNKVIATNSTLTDVFAG